MGQAKAELAVGDIQAVCSAAKLTRAKASMEVITSNKDGVIDIANEFGVEIYSGLWD